MVSNPYDSPKLSFSQDNFTGSVALTAAAAAAAEFGGVDIEAAAATPTPTPTSGLRVDSSDSRQDSTDSFTGSTGTGTGMSLAARGMAVAYNVVNELLKLAPSSAAWRDANRLYVSCFRSICVCLNITFDLFFIIILGICLARISTT